MSLWCGYKEFLSTCLCVLFYFLYVYYTIYKKTFYCVIAFWGTVVYRNKRLGTCRDKVRWVFADRDIIGIKHRVRA